MDLIHLSLAEKLDLAISSTEQTLLKLLSASPEMLVRRALLRNQNITKEIVDFLAFDATENVSYIAISHSKCSAQRTFDEPVSKCVQCRVDERKISCNTCPHL